MSEKVITSVVSILVAIMGVAYLSVLVSRSSNTTGVIAAGSGGFRDALCTAISPLGVKCGTRSPIEDVTSTITFG